MDVKKVILSVLAALAGVSASVVSVASTDCSVESIERLPVDQQMKQYTLCASLMEKRIELLKKQKEISKLMGADNSAPQDHKSGTAAVPSVPESLPPSLPPVTTGSSEPVVTAIEGAGDKLRATLQWPDGSTARVSKGVTVKGYEVLDVTIDGINARRVKESGYKVKKGDVIFIPVGTGGGIAQGAPMMGAPTSPVIPTP